METRAERCDETDKKYITIEQTEVSEAREAGPLSHRRMIGFSAAGH